MRVSMSFCLFVAMFALGSASTPPVQDRRPITLHCKNGLLEGFDYYVSGTSNVFFVRFSAADGKRTVRIHDNTEKWVEETTFSEGRISSTSTPVIFETRSEPIKNG